MESTNFEILRQQGKHLKIDEAFEQGYITKWFYDLIMQESDKQRAKTNNRTGMIKDIVSK